MSGLGKIWIGVDPGGVGNFGLAILKADGSCHACSVAYVDAAIDAIRKHVRFMLAGIGVDAPLWWCSGSAGLRKADQWIRDKYGLPNRNVQAVNSLWGSVLAQGMMFVVRIREVFPDVSVTETHPKAVLKALSRETWENYFEAMPTDVALDSKQDHLRDALYLLWQPAKAFKVDGKKTWLTIAIRANKAPPITGSPPFTTFGPRDRWNFVSPILSPIASLD